MSKVLLLPISIGEVGKRWIDSALWGGPLNSLHSRNWYCRYFLTMAVEDKGRLLTFAPSTYPALVRGVSKGSTARNAWYPSSEPRSRFRRPRRMAFHCCDSSPSAQEAGDTGDADAGGQKALYADPDVGEMGFIDMYAGELDEIDKSNYTFGQYNKMTENDKLFGKDVMVENVGSEGPLKMFYREVSPKDGCDPSCAVLMLSGLPASSYSWREVLPAVAESTGVRCVAPDWIGLGFSDKPAPGFVFSYSTEAYVDSLTHFLEAIGVTKLRCVVVQGWLATNGLLFALKNSDLVDSIYILNSPLPPTNPKMPFAMSKWGFPGMMGDAFAQDSLSTEKAIEGGSTYKLAIADCEGNARLVRYVKPWKRFAAIVLTRYGVLFPPNIWKVYRRPFMNSGDSGFSLAAATRGLAMKATWERLRGISSWDKPIGVAWGLDDKYLPLSAGEAFVQNVCPQAEFSTMEGCGHFAQEDFGVRVAENLNKFLRTNLDSTNVSG